VFPAVVYVDIPDKVIPTNVPLIMTFYVPAQYITKGNSVFNNNPRNCIPTQYGKPNRRIQGIIKRLRSGISTRRNSQSCYVASNYDESEDR